MLNCWCITWPVGCKRLIFAQWWPFKIPVLCYTMWCRVVEVYRSFFLFWILLPSPFSLRMEAELFFDTLYTICNNIPEDCSPNNNLYSGFALQVKASCVLTCNLYGYTTLITSNSATVNVTWTVVAWPWTKLPLFTRRPYVYSCSGTNKCGRSWLALNFLTKTRPDARWSPILGAFAEFAKSDY